MNDTSLYNTLPISQRLSLKQNECRHNQTPKTGLSNPDYGIEQHTELLKLNLLQTITSKSLLTEVQTVKAYCRQNHLGQRITLKTPIYPSPLASTSRSSTDCWLSANTGTSEESPHHTAPPKERRRSDSELRIPIGNLSTHR